MGVSDYEGELVALHVQPDELQRHTVYRVSVEDGRLVEVEHGADL